MRNRMRQPAIDVSEEFFTALEAYDWPGNVRELLNAVDHALAMEPNCPTLYPKHLPEYIRMHAIGTNEGGLPLSSSLDTAGLLPDWEGDFPTLKKYRLTAVERAERHYLSRIMAHCANDVDQACKISGLKRARLYQLLKKYSKQC